MGIEVKNIKMERSIKNLTYFGLTFIQLRMNKYKNITLMKQIAREMAVH
jgi:hypothetical protein